MYEQCICYHDKRKALLSSEQAREAREGPDRSFCGMCMVKSYEKASDAANKIRRSLEQVERLPIEAREEQSYN